MFDFNILLYVFRLILILSRVGYLYYGGVVLYTIASMIYCDKKLILQYPLCFIVAAFIKFNNFRRQILRILKYCKLCHD